MSKKPEGRVQRLCEQLADWGWPARIHVAKEPGYISGASAASVMPWPRLNICLRGKAVYQIRDKGEPYQLALGLREAVYTAQGCALGLSGDANYVALGLVLQPEMTMFVVAHSGCAGPHRFLFRHYAPRALDHDGWGVVRVLEKCNAPRFEGALAATLAKALLLLSCRTLNAGSDPGLGKAQLTWQAAVHFIGENLHRPLDRQEVADFLNVHPNHLSRLFRRFYGNSFNQYVLDVRMERACELLNDPAMNINQIAYACGYRDPSYFVRTYRKKYGHTPGRDRGYEWM